MRYLFDLPEAAVARDLGITVGTVKSTSSRALAKLRVRAGDEAGLQPTGLQPTGPRPIGGERP
jgi:DNA-directed RNA polymerase specialized sigma24 family protein